MTSELRGCPFCGGEAGIASVIGEWWARCLSCEAATVLTLSKDRAITAWNTRAKADQIMGVEGEHVHADLCRISRAALGAGSPLDLRDDLDRRANETMKALIASALKGPTHDR
jgi:cytochrome c5